MSDMLSIGVTGLRAYQTALTTTSENIANASTPGYVRRSAVIREVMAPSAPGSNAMNGMGSAVTTIVRSVALFRAEEVRNASADLARTQTGATWLEAIEGALTGHKLGDRLTAFFNSSSAVAADPSAIAPRAAMLEAAASAATAFAGTGAALARAATDLAGNAQAAADELGQLATALGRVNHGLSRADPGTAGAASLADQRDRLLEAMSEIIDVTATFDSAGRAVVRVGGTSGPILVEGTSTGTVSFLANDEGAFSFALTRDAGVHMLLPQSGALAGMAEGAQRIADARVQIDALAESFVEGVNDFQANGHDLAGAAGAAMFAVGDSPSAISLALTDPRGIAAAAVGGGTRDNRNLATLDALRASGGFETGVTDMVTANASALTGRRAVVEAQTSIRDTAVAARDSASGVNMDEEAVDLIRFQQAYQAASRIIQIARETLQSILEIR